MEVLLLGGAAIFLSRLEKKKLLNLNFLASNNNDTCNLASDVLKIRTLDGLTEETRALIELVTLQNDVFPVGSFKYKAHRYPGDIDIFEPVKACCDKETASKSIANKIQTMAKEIQIKPKVYLGDFKAGLDERYTINFLENSRDILENLRDNNLLSEKDFTEAITIANLDDLQEFMRKFRIVRWNLEELITGFKILPGDVQLTLSEALTHKSVVKIDLWAPLNGNYNEITNFFLIIMIDEDGKEIVLNEELGDRLVNLNHDIVKYSSKKNKNSLKLAKRLWNRALFLKDKEMPKLLYPLFQSGCNSLNQIAGESEVVRMMIQKLLNPPIEELLLQIDGFRRRITDVFDVDFEPQPMFNVIKNILNSRINIIDGLLELESMLKKVVEKHASNWIKCNVPNLNSLIEEAKENEKYVNSKGLNKNNLGDLID